MCIRDSSKADATSLSIDRIAKLVSLSCVIVDLKLLCISFSLLNDLSHDATDTGIVRRSLSAMTKVLYASNPIADMYSIIRYL